MLNRDDKTSLDLSSVLSSHYFRKKAKYRKIKKPSNESSIESVNIVTERKKSLGSRSLSNKLKNDEASYDESVSNESENSLDLFLSKRIFSKRKKPSSRKVKQ